jgi:hypothetical protein
MKKFILLMLLALNICVQANAQNVKNDGKPYAFYCIIVGSRNLAGQLRLQILWDNMKTENNLRDKDGKKIEFKSMVDALNYMSKRGWDYVESVTYEQVVHFVFRKYVTKDEDAKEDLYFQFDNKK